MGNKKTPKINRYQEILDKLLLKPDRKISGFFLGFDPSDSSQYIGKKSEDDGNILIVGTNGSGKSYILAKSALETWRDAPFIALDIKGELSNHYDCLRKNKKVYRHYNTFDPIDGISYYDPYILLQLDDPHFVQYVREISHSIIPKPINLREPYWIDMARDLLCGAIVYGFTIGLNFIETMIFIHDNPVSKLCKEISGSTSQIAKMFISDISYLKPEHQASIGTEMKRHTMIFATDPYIQAALCKNENGYEVAWKHMDDRQWENLFICINQDKLEQWSVVIRLMLVQLIRYLERRADKHTSNGETAKPILILLDEFASLGKMDIIASALTTLRSKKVTFCLVLQSLAQLDMIYGTDTRRIIVDNCQYKAILNVTETNSQEYFSHLIGTTLKKRKSKTVNYDSEEQFINSIGKGKQESLESIILPHRLAYNNGILLHTPVGCVMTIKRPLSPNLSDSCKEKEIEKESKQRKTYITVEERIIKLREKIKQIQFSNDSNNQKTWKETESDEVSNKRIYLVGKMFIKYFKFSLNFRIHDNDLENEMEFQLLENFFKLLSEQYKTYQEIENKVAEWFEDFSE